VTEQACRKCHADSGAGVLKAQHPEFETWNQGIHARSGVTCADCHMPYVRVGALKISDHRVRSPMIDINNACQTCHKWPEAELRARVETIQDRVFGLRNRALAAVVALIGDLKVARERGKSDTELDLPRKLQRRAQFMLDFVEAENSTGFSHAAGGRAGARRIDRLRPTGTTCAARRHSAGPAHRRGRDTGRPGAAGRCVSRQTATPAVKPPRMAARTSRADRRRTAGA